MAESIWMGAIAREPAPTAAVAPASLLAAVKQGIGSEFARHAARFIGEDEFRTQSAFELLVSAILRRLARRSATPDGAARVFADLRSPRIDSDLLATVERLLADEPEEQGERLDPGEQAAHALFGRRTGSLVFGVGSVTGLGVEAVWQLLGLTRPLVYAALRDHATERGFNAEALQQRLASEYPTARSVRRRPLHRAVASAAGRTLRSTRGVLARAAAAAARRDHLALVLGALIAVAAALPWQSGVSPIDAAASAGSGSVISPIAFADGPMPGATRSAGADGLRAFLSGDASEVEYVLALDGVQFEPASATLKSVSNAQLAQLASALTDFPEARLAIEVHADGATGEAQDRALSERRALAVRAALAGFGVRPSRMSHAGISGVTQPGTRIEARVTKG